MENENNDLLLEERLEALKDWLESELLWFNSVKHDLQAKVEPFGIALENLDFRTIRASPRVPKLVLLDLLRVWRLALIDHEIYLVEREIHEKIVKDAHTKRPWWARAALTLRWPWSADEEPVFTGRPIPPPGGEEWKKIFTVDDKSSTLHDSFTSMRGFRRA